MALTERFGSHHAPDAPSDDHGGFVRAVQNVVCKHEGKLSLN